MPCVMSFGFSPFAIYKDAPMGLGKARLALNSTAVPIRGKGWGGAAIVLSGAARVNLLPLPARNERGEGWGEGKLEQKFPPSPPAEGAEGELFALSALLALRRCFRNRPVRGPGLQRGEYRRVSCRPPALPPGFLDISKN